MASNPYVARWLAALVDTPGLTAVRTLEEARALHVDEALDAVPLLLDGTLIDVGSGGGAPGIPLAVACPTTAVTLLEANGRKAEFLERWVAELDNATVVRGRAEEYATGAGFERFDNATARALAPPAVAIEWTLPLVRTGGRLILYTTLPHEAAVAGVAPLVGGRLVETIRPAPASERALCVVEKAASTPPGFPRRTGVARKRPLVPAASHRHSTLEDRAAP